MPSFRASDQMTFSPVPKTVLKGYATLSTCGTLRSKVLTTRQVPYTATSWSKRLLTRTGLATNSLPPPATASSPVCKATSTTKIRQNSLLPATAVCSHPGYQICSVIQSRSTQFTKRFKTPKQLMTPWRPITGTGVLPISWLYSARLQKITLKSKQCRTKAKSYLQKFYHSLKPKGLVRWLQQDNDLKNQNQSQKQRCFSHFKMINTTSQIPQTQLNRTCLKNNSHL